MKSDPTRCADMCELRWLDMLRGPGSSHLLTGTICVASSARTRGAYICVHQQTIVQHLLRQDAIKGGASLQIVSKTDPHLHTNLPEQAEKMVASSILSYVGLSVLSLATFANGSPLHAGRKCGEGPPECHLGKGASFGVGSAFAAFDSDCYDWLYSWCCIEPGQTSG